MMENIDDETAGKFRTFDVAIQGANWFPVRWPLVKKAFGEFIGWYKKNKKKLHPVELAAIAHLKFIEVHPFGDGNGRIGRLIMNRILMKNGYPPLNIKVKETIEYVKALQFAQNNQKFKELAGWFLHKMGEQYVKPLTG
jgi:Fic family protein